MGRRGRRLVDRIEGQDAVGLIVAVLTTVAGGVAENVGAMRSVVTGAVGGATSVVRQKTAAKRSTATRNRAINRATRKRNALRTELERLSASL